MNKLIVYVLITILAVSAIGYLLVDNVDIVTTAGTTIREHTLNFDYSLDQRDYQYEIVCRHISVAMILKYYDDNYRTNYLGNPFSPGLIDDNPTQLLYFNSMANFRGQPTAEKTTYCNCNFCDDKPGYENDIHIDISDGEFFMNEIDNFRPVFIKVCGHASVIYGYMVYDFNGEEWVYFKIADTYGNSKEKHINDLCCTSCGQTNWYIRQFHTLEVFDYPPLNPDLNGDGNHNSGDVRYLAGHIMNQPGYEYIYGNPDVNSDGNLNSGDVRYFAMNLVGNPDYQPLWPGIDYR